MSEPYFATGYIRLLYRFARVEVAAKKLFQGTGCAEADLMRAEFEMPFSAQMRLVRNALTHTEPGLGLRLGNQLQLAAHGALGIAMQSAPDLESALSTFCRFVAVRASFYALSRFEEGQSTTLRIAIHGLPADLIPFFSESILLTLTHCLTFYSGRQDGRNQVQFNYARPAYGSAYPGVFGSHISFKGAHTQIRFDRSLLSLPSPEADETTYLDSIRRCRALIDQRRPHHDLVQSIENFLLENPGRLWTVNEIAPLFSVSTRTLIRHLKAVGISYQTLRDGALKRQAASCLASMSVEATALSLGFADTSSFRRTFKRWFGMTPSQFSLTQEP